MVFLEDSGRKNPWYLCPLCFGSFFFLNKKLKHQPVARLLFRWDEEIGAVPLNSMKLLCLRMHAALVMDLSQYFQLSWMCTLPLNAVQCVFDFNNLIALCLSRIGRSSLGRCLVNTINYINWNEGPKPSVLIRLIEMVFYFLIV